MTRNEMRQDLVLLVVAAPFLAIIKPYGLYENFPFWKAWMLWAGFLGAGSLLLRLGAHIFKGRLPTTHWGIVTVLKTLVITPFIFGIIVFSFKLTQSPIPYAFWPSIFGKVFVMGLAITGVTTAILNARQTTEFAIPAPPLTQTFMQNLPIKYRSAELYAVSAEDHYLRVHTSTGDPLILMRFKDALAELSEVHGTQTHRSWWVAVLGVADTTRENARLSLVLKTGVKAPVSRTYMAAVKAIGLQV